MNVIEAARAASPVGAWVVTVDVLPGAIAAGRKAISLGGVWRVLSVDGKYRQLNIIGGEGIAKGERLELIPNG